MAKKKDVEWTMENTQRYELRIPPSFLTIVDDWRRREPDIPSRAEAIRRLVELGVASSKSAGKAKAK